MYLDILLVERLGLDGVMTTYLITPLKPQEQVVVDHLEDIDIDFESPDTVDIGPFRVYNASTCSIQIQESRSQHITLSDNQELSIEFGHRGLTGSRWETHGGYYIFLLPPTFRFTELHIIDTDDNSHHNLEDNGQREYQILWDTKHKISLVYMEGKLSFIFLGKAKVFRPAKALDYLDVERTKNVISDLLRKREPLIPPKVRGKLVDDMTQKLEWFELKPNFMGIGINFNAIIRDILKLFSLD